jgi:hypothetical protein
MYVFQEFGVSRRYARFAENPSPCLFRAQTTRLFSKASSGIAFAKYALGEISSCGIVYRTERFSVSPRKDEMATNSSPLSFTFFENPFSLRVIESV